MMTRLPRCSLFPALPLEVARSKLCLQVLKAPLQSPIAATCPFKAASTNIILRCIIAGVAEKKSSFPLRVCSYPRVVHLAFLAPSSCMVSTQRPVKGLVVASVRGTTSMSASLTFVSFSRCVLRASAIASDVFASSHSAWVLQFGASEQVVNLHHPRFQHAQRVPLPEMLSLSERSFQLWASLELRLLRSFFASGAPSASVSAGLVRALSAGACSAADSIVCLDLFPWLGTAAVSGSSGLHCALGIGPIKIGSRSLRTFSGLPRVTGVGFHGSQTMAFKRMISQRRFSTVRFNARLRTMPVSVPIKWSSVLLSRPSQTPSRHADSNLWTSAPGRLHATTSPTSRMGLW